jgi:ComF family protein
MFTTLDYLKKFYYWLLPPTCILCHAKAASTRDLCAACIEDLPILPQSCPVCAKTLTGSPAAGLHCGDCLRQPPAFDATYALFAYLPPITKLIMELKFHHKLVNARILGQLMADTLQNRWYYNKTLPDVIIPVPLHAKRLQERGFNQALEIARPISKILQIPLDTFSCQRTRHTTAQARLAAEQRHQNIKNAFIINQDFTGQTIALLDDVITTGQTIEELSKTLKKAGTKRIDVWALARAGVA